ncbi:MAG: hypothetical protein H0V25_04880, partial [Solirubrobacterales bacterium]|nr:hypothetical protein [Solirubrobacterales bacterium]
MAAGTKPRPTGADAGSGVMHRFGGGLVERDSLLAAPLRCQPRQGRLSLPITSMRGVGPKLEAAAARIGLRTLGDLIDNVPHGYGDVAEVTEIAELRIGERATILVEVRSARTRPTRRRSLRIVEAVVADGSGPLSVTWFNQAWLAERLRPGAKLLLSGRLDRHGFRPDAQEFIDDRNAGDAGDGGGRDPIRDSPGPPAGLHTTGIVPVHPCGEGLRVPRLREWTWHALAHVTDVVEPLPAALR